MSQFETGNIYAVDEDGLKSYILNVFTRMGLAMVLTAVVAGVVYYNLENNGLFARLLFQNSWIMIVIALLQLGMCLAMSVGITKFSTFAVTGLFYGYAAFTGITFSTLPYVYGVETLFTAFAFTAVLFFSCVVIGHTTKVDMSKFSGLMIGGLVTLIIITVLSLFIPFLRNSLMINYFGVILFLALTAYDMQRIKRFYYTGDIRENLAVYGAFQLYLDFINLFLQILRILSRSSSRKK